MGLFEKLFPKKAQYVPDGYWQTLTAYTPVFSSRAGSAYESELVRAAIDSRSRHIGKLKIVFRGNAQPYMQRKLSVRPNDLMTWYKFLYRVNTILDMQNNCFLIPTYDQYGRIDGIYPILPSRAELVKASGTNEPWIRYQFTNGTYAAMELSKCGVLTKFQYYDDVFGSTQSALSDTLDLIDLEKKGVGEAIKSGATYKFMAQVTNWTKDSDLAKEKKRFNKENFEKEEDGGVFLLLPKEYGNVQQINMHPYTVPKDELELIQTNVFNYFGTNMDVMQNKADGNQLDAFFNGAIEPVSIMMSEVFTAMIYSESERENGNEIIFSANRLQYMSTGTKIQMVQQLSDRGMLLIDEGRELFNLPPLPDDAGKRVPIRGEYYMLVGENVNKDEGGNNNATNE